jgi:hypothetical protein
MTVSFSHKDVLLLRLGGCKTPVPRFVLNELGLVLSVARFRFRLRHGSGMTA